MLYVFSLFPKLKEVHCWRFMRETFKVSRRFRLGWDLRVGSRKTNVVPCQFGLSPSWNHDVMESARAHTQSVDATAYLIGTACRHGRKCGTVNGSFGTEMMSNQMTNPPIPVTKRFESFDVMRP
eukprot:512782-Amphidinium_carterae.1